MTDIYIRQSRRRGGCVAFSFLAILLAGGGVWLFWPHSPQTSADSPVTSGLAGGAPPTSRRSSPSTPSAPPPDLDAIEQQVEAGRLREARTDLYALRDSLSDPVQRRPVERLLGDVHTRLVFSDRPMEEKTTHIVRSGDTVGELARTYGTTPELIRAINGFEGNLIRTGERLQILQGVFRVEVGKRRNEMEVYLDGRFFKRYRVGTGTHNSTPEGDYKITLRLEHPVWYRPDGQSFPYGHPENLLGTHYLKLDTPGIGLHGTWEPESVGSQSSAGCVRLKNEEIQELYRLLPEGTAVKIVE